MTRVVVVDLLCNSPYYCAPLTAALRDAGADAELASPRFYLEPDYLDAYPVASWILDLAVHARRPRWLRVVVRAVEAGWNLARLVIRIRARRYDVVHVQWVPLEDRTAVLMQLLRRVCARSDTVLVRTAHNVLPHDRPDADRATIRRNLDAADLVVAHTDHVAAELRDDIGVGRPIVSIPHGPMFVDQPLPPAVEARQRRGISGGRVVLFLGLIRAYKGLDLLAAAWPQVLAGASDARLLVVGKVADPDVTADIDRLRGADGVTVVDRYVSIAEMLDYYAVSDVVVFPYHRISQSGALMTAVGLGRPTVVTPIDGLREQVAAVSSATIAESVTADALAAALASSLARVETLDAAASRDRSAIAGSAVGWSAIADATLAAYASERSG